MRVTGVALHTPTGLHHHHLQPPMDGFQVAPEPATGWQQPYQKHGGWQQQYQKHGGWQRSSDQSAREESLSMEGDEGAEEQHRAAQQQQQQQQQQQLETVGEKLSQLQRSLLAKQTYLAKASIIKSYQPIGLIVDNYLQ